MTIKFQDIRALPTKLGEVKIYGHFVNGQWVEGHSAQTIKLSNPMTGRTLAYIQAHDAVDVDHVVNAAYDALPHWSRASSVQRQAILGAIAGQLRARQFYYAIMETLNTGKTITKTLTHEIAEAIGFFEYYASTSVPLRGKVSLADSPILTHYERIRVAKRSAPWNVPFFWTALKLAPALTAGRTVVLKPPKTGCISVLEFIKVIVQVLPPGVINVVTDALDLSWLWTSSSIGNDIPSGPVDCIYHRGSY